MKNSLFLFYIFLFFIPFTAFADTENNDNCTQAELISEMHNQTGSYSRTETGTVQSGDDDYYYFTIPQTGTLTINYTSTANTDLRIQAGVSCLSTITRVLNNGSSYSNSLSITAGQTVYVRIQRRNGTPNYSLGLSFVPTPPTLSIANASQNEGNSGTSYMNFTVTLSQSATATVNYTTSNGTATAGSDYTAKTEPLTFTSGGVTTQTISIPIMGDTAIESDETFYVTLSNPSGATISTTTATGIILNDDNPPTIEFQQSLYQTAEDTSLPFNSSSTMLMTVILSKAVDDNITVEFATQDGTAIGTTNSGTDYISQSGTITIPAGETSVSLPMYIIHDQPIEITENFSVILKNPQPSGSIALGTNASAIVQILEQTSAPLCYSDNFDTTLDSKWRTLYSSGGFTPQINQGHLKLTPGKYKISTAVTKDYEFPSKENLIIIEFKHYAYGGCFEESTPAKGIGDYGADGIVAVLYDSSIGASPTPGAYGGSMGYAQKTGINGFQGGWLGLGLDEFGNFSNPTEGRIGGPGSRINAAVIRGGGSGTSGYNFLQEAYPVSPTIAPIIDITNPDKLPGDKFQMTVDARDTSHLFIKLERDINDGNGYQTIINKFDAKLAIYNQSATPDYVRFALTAGTGDGCNAHEIDDLVVRGNCSAYVPTLSGAFRVTEDSSTASWSTKWLNNNLKTQIAPLNKRYCVLAGTSANNSASPLSSSVTVDVNLTDNSGFNQRVAHNLAIPAASSITCFDVTTSSAAKQMQFIISNPSDASMLSYSDTFAIRPKSFSININDSNPNKLLAGKNYTLDINATSTLSDGNVSGYNTTLGTATLNTSVLKVANPSMTTCPVNTIQTESLTFNEGRSTLSTFTYNDVMDINFTISDGDWTSTDQVSGGCTLNSDSTSSTPVGCLIKGTKQFKFIPHHFNLIGTVSNHDTNFTYLSSDFTMSAVLDVNITAKTENNATTSSYNSLCYAKITDYNISYDALAISPANSLTKINFFETNTLKADSSLINTNLNISNVDKTIFGIDNNGTGTMKIKLNFDRDNTKVVNPFKLNLRDINVTDEDTVTGTKDINQSSLFYYGRVYSTDYRAPSPIDTTIRYEVYCKDCNKTALGVTGTQSPLSLYWYQNPLHVIADGNVTAFTSATTGSKATTIANATVSTINAGTGMDNTHRLTNTNAPYTDIIQMNPSSWLRYNQYSNTATTNDFTVEFTRAGNWSGAGNVERNETSHTTGAFTNTNDLNRTNRKMNW
ncbi:Calx-beta domain-containing protein [Sulfurospirillum halorespirans]|uniref:Calx-beta domain-containing protein n=1 Tax=Sulfurospirillum halorespirans DSM 13726 TaxID=1193502 RepID=A0A1D7TIP9_9BACT|nr:Calx-beta domain-containing protein [Sulfurospirillum halorespirans]AOO64895.1 hypothetical protein SHALO_1115 [Sulfurospirillum halorespirans DSM 13726]